MRMDIKTQTDLLNPLRLFFYLRAVARLFLGPSRKDKTKDTKDSAKV